MNRLVAGNWVYTWSKTQENWETHDFAKMSFIVCRTLQPYCTVRLTVIMLRRLLSVVSDANVLRQNGRSYDHAVFTEKYPSSSRFGMFSYETKFEWFPEIKLCQPARNFQRYLKVKCLSSRSWLLKKYQYSHVSCLCLNLGSSNGI